MPITRVNDINASSMPVTRRERTLIGKTSLLRIVPMACGQAANKGAAHDWHHDGCRHTNARRLRIGRNFTSRSTLGAIIPLHDVRYHAPALKPRGSMMDA